MKPASKRSPASKSARGYEPTARRFRPNPAAAPRGEIVAEEGRAVEQRQGWLGFYWALTALFGKYEMVKLDWAERFTLNTPWPIILGLILALGARLQAHRKASHD